MVQSAADPASTVFAAASTTLRSPLRLPSFLPLPTARIRLLAPVLWSFWLLAFGLYCGVPRFYLWDLLPAVFLSHPELFERRSVALRASAQDLRTGLLVERADGAARVNMPPRLLDRGRLLEHPGALVLPDDYCAPGAVRTDLLAALSGRIRAELDAAIGPVGPKRRDEHEGQEYSCKIYG